MSRKMIALILFLACLALSPLPTSAAPPIDFDWEQVDVGYLPNRGDWWSGIAITNISSQTISPVVHVYNEDGPLVITEHLDPLAPHEVFIIATSSLDKAAVPFSDVVSMVITSSTDDAKFAVTSFVGNSEMGFGLQQQTSTEKVMVVTPL